MMTGTKSLETGNWMVIYSSGAVIKYDSNDGNGERAGESCG